MPIILYSFFSFILGAFWGSFANVIIYRWPRDMALGLKKLRRSQCTSCGSTIQWQHNIPIFSYFLLKGNCAVCKKKIPFSYLVVEILCAIIFAFTSFILLSYPPLEIAQKKLLLYVLINLYFCFTLLCLSVIDLKHYLIPDRFSIGNTFLALSASFVSLTTISFQEAFISALCVYLFFFAFAFIFKKLRGIEGLGQGDIKLLSFFAALLGWQSIFFIIMLGSILGLILGVFAMRKNSKKLQTAIPFGPFLAFSAYIYLVLLHWNKEMLSFLSF